MASEFPQNRLNGVMRLLTCFFRFWSGGVSLCVAFRCQSPAFFGEPTRTNRAEIVLGHKYDIPGLVEYASPVATCLLEPDKCNTGDDGGDLWKLQHEDIYASGASWAFPGMRHPNPKKAQKLKGERLDPT